ncbi:MAG: BMC domain-containing protein [Kiritimatiellae bacterium]|nr:BMC domain-containing protein [Kiritimatiellia bacterium]
MDKKQQAALAVIEFKSVPVGIYAADALMKKSPISLLKAGTIGCGKYMIVLAGTTASVEEARAEALYHGGEQVVDEVLLPDVHEALYDAVLGGALAVGEGPLFVLETPGVASCCAAVERMLKGVPVKLVALRLGDPQMGGKGLAVVQGSLYDVEAAQELATAEAEARGQSAQYRLLTAPTDFILKELASSSKFRHADLLQLGGETPS